MKTKHHFLIAVLMLVTGCLIGYTATKVVLTKNKSSNILKVLEDNCNCKEVNQIIYAKGIQYGKNGLSTERAEYELVNCEFTSATAEINRINSVLHQEIENFHEVDVVEIEFENGTSNQTFVIKNGKVQTTKN